MDIAVAQEARPATSVLSAPKLFKRATIWFAIGLFQGSANSLYFTSFDAKREGELWQLEPLLYDSTYYFICKVGLVGVVMMRAYHDRKTNVIKFYILVNCSFVLTTVGACSPYPLVATLGSVLFLLNSTFGLYFLVTKIDKGAEQENVRTATNYSLLSGSQAFRTSISTLRFSPS